MPNHWARPLIAAEIPALPRPDDFERGNFGFVDDGGAITQTPRFGLALLGGFRAGGRLRLGDRLTRISLLGGVDLDLTEAEFAANRLMIVKVSLLGGVDLRVPADARVEVHGLSIGGRDLGPGAGGPDGPEIVIHAYGLLGGVKVRRTPSP